MEDRIALIIGNGAYSHIGRLKNPTNDAVLVGNALLEVGFELVGGGIYLDVEKPEIEQGVLEFSKRLHQRATGLLYFSGHGLQLGGTNYLIPISANPARITHLETELVDIAMVLNQMYRAQALLNIVLLDACRSNPFAQGLFQGTGTGLAAIQAAAGTVLSYATQPGNVALDGSDANSPYALAIVEALRQPGLSIFEVFNAVGLEVSRRTNGAQMPWMSISPLPQPFYFRSPVVVQPQPPVNVPVELRVQPGEGSLQQAIDAISEGGTIRLAPGTYRENLHIQKSVHLIGESSANQVVLTAESGHTVVNIEDTQDVRLQGLKIHADGCLYGLMVNRATIRIEECRFVTAPTPADAEAQSCGIYAQQEAQVTILQTSILNFDYAIYNDNSSTATGDGLELEGRWQLQGELDCYGAVANSGSQLTLKNSRIRHFRQASRAGFGQENTAEVVLENCTLSDVNYGVVVVTGAQATVRACDILFVAYGVYNTGKISLLNCRRLNAQNDEAWCLLTEGQLSASGCRIFGGNTGAVVRSGGTLILQGCEIFDTTDEGIYCAEDAQLRLQNCQVHHHQNNGVTVKGKADLEQSAIHNNCRGVVCKVQGVAQIEECQIYENQAGVLCDDRAQVKILNSLLFGQTVGGVCTYEQGTTQIHNTIFRNNESPVYACGAQTHVTLTDCDLRRNAILQTIKCAEGAAVQQQKNQFSNQEEGLNFYQSQDYTRRNHADFFIARFSEILDLLDTFFYRHLRDWSLADRRLSPDGMRCTYRYGRNTQERIQLEPHGLGRLADGFLQGSQVSILNYALRLEVEIAVVKAVADTEMVSVQTDEEEIIRNLSGGAVVNSAYWAPSLLLFSMEEKYLPVGELLLYYLQIELARPILQ